MLINNREPGGGREGGGYCKCAVCESHNFLIPLQYAEKIDSPQPKIKPAEFVFVLYLNLKLPIKKLLLTNTKYILGEPTVYFETDLRL